MESRDETSPSMDHDARLRLHPAGMVDGDVDGSVRVLWSTDSFGDQHRLVGERGRFVEERCGPRPLPPRQRTGMGDLDTLVDSSQLPAPDCPGEKRVVEPSGQNLATGHHATLDVEQVGDRFHVARLRQPRARSPLMSWLGGRP